MLMIVGLPLILAPCVFVIVTACMFQFVGPVFLYFFKSSGYRTAHGSLTLKPYLTTCNMTVMHEDNAVGLVET